MKKPLYIITILANCFFAFSQSPDKFSIQPAIEVDANFYKITLELKEGKDDDDYKQKDKVDLPVTFLFNNKFVTGKYTGSCIKIKVLYTDSKKEQSDKLYLPSGKGKFTSTLFSYDGDWQFDNFNGMGSIQWVNYEYEGDFVRGQFTGKGKMVYANGNIYEGDWLNNDRSNGYGKMIYKDGSIKDGLKGNQMHTYQFYQGNWLFELFNGKGKMTYTNGDTLNGIWNGLKFNGYGKLTYANGAIYDGNWKDGEKNGKGKLTKVNGEVLDGLFNMGLFTGKAKIRYENGTTYDGDYVDNKFQGYGTYTYKDGESYTGQWANNKYNGKGKLSYVNGDKYEGDFVDNFYKGKGKLTYANGDIYDGDFVDDKKQGNGTFTFKAGGSYTGQWADNKYNGKGKLIYENGDIYEGDFVNGKKQGNGKMTGGDDVIIYNGQWANDLYNGHGKLNMITQTGDNSYIGDFVDGKKQGNGTQEYNHELGGAVTYTGQWANDEYNGQGKLILRDNKIQEGLFVNGTYQPIAKKTATTDKTAFKEVTIGTQVWMTENLNVAKFRNGDTIPQAKTQAEWEKAGINDQPAWCYYDNDPANGAKYGKLYNWYAVHDPRGLAPKGYHIPTDEEWTKLTDYLGGETGAGTKMKSTSGWKENGNGTNSSGFSGLPGGYRFYFGTFYNIGNYGNWWSSAEDGTSSAWYRNLYYNLGDVSRFIYSKA